MTGDRKEALQGLIQLAVACHHLQMGNRSGASKMFLKAQEHLKDFHPVVFNIILDPLLESIGICIRHNAPGSLPKLTFLE